MEFIETYQPGGEITSRLVCADLPIAYDRKRYSYNIKVRVDGWCECISRAEGGGSVRYYSFRTYDLAMAHATSWAKRKIAQSKRGA
jgi:hypothetical protein